MHQVKERIAGENVKTGWHNRMSENRRVMAEQMKEIAVALKSFTINLGETEELPKERKRRILEELKKEGIKVARLSVKKRGGYLEVMFTGACHGNHCLTKTDAAQALYRATGIMMCPARETEEMCFLPRRLRCFSDRTRCIRHFTGLARVAKSGGECVLVAIIRFWNFREPVSFSWF